MFDKKQIAGIIKESYIQKKNQSEIAAELNAKGLVTKHGKPWRQNTVSYYALHVLKLPALMVRKGKEKRQIHRMKKMNGYADKIVQPKTSENIWAVVTLISESNLNESAKAGAIKGLLGL